MIRRLNFTGRRRIPRGRVQAVFHPSETRQPRFDLTMDLQGLDLPREATLHVEAYRGPWLQRYDWGTVGSPSPPTDREMRDYPGNVRPSFRVKAVDGPPHPGRILGLAEKVQPRLADEDPEAGVCLLYVDYRDIDQQVWRLDLAGDWPLLVLNSQLDEPQEMARSAEFLGLVYPVVMLLTLEEALLVRDWEPESEEEDEDWPGLWVRFALGFLGGPPPPGGGSERARNARQDWIERAVGAFCASHASLDRFSAARRTR